MKNRIETGATIVGGLLFFGWVWWAQVRLPILPAAGMLTSNNEIYQQYRAAYALCHADPDDLGLLPKEAKALKASACAQADVAMQKLTQRGAL